MIIETKDIVKEYSGRRVVNRVSIKVEQGKVVGLLGPNGAGKTTTFYMIVGIERPDEGVVTLEGEDISALAMYERARAGIGYLPQEASIFRKMTVEENILAILETTALSEEERLAKMNSLIEEFHIDHIRKNKGTELSGGELQRFCIARALAANPRYLLADEITAMFDAVTQSQIWQALLHEAKERELGMVIVSHSESLLKRICTRRIDLKALQEKMAAV